MAIYSIKTTRTQQVGLQYSYDTYADKMLYPTIQEYFQMRIDHQVSDAMYQDQQSAQLKSFDQSFNTIPEAEQPAARTEIENTITSHGGTIVPASPPVINPSARSIPRGAILTPGGTSSNPIQVGGRSKEAPEPSGPDGGSDNPTES